MNSLANGETIRFRSSGIYDLDGSFLSDEIKAAALDCIGKQKVAAKRAYADFVPRADALEQVSAEALARVVSAGKDIHGISTDRSISNVISFRMSQKHDAIADTAVEESRKKVDALIADALRDLFVSDARLSVVSSGHFWYPAGSYMAWHTNSKVPGWRMYINYAEEEKRSFFRYREPESGEIVTLHDRQWNLRLFRITEGNPVWHTVYSNTNRFSLGYMIREEPVKNPWHRIARKIRQLASA